jgi:hypothetical protein
MPVCVFNFPSNLTEAQRLASSFGQLVDFIFELVDIVAAGHINPEFLELTLDKASKEVG